MERHLTLDDIKNDIKAIGPLELSRRTGISRSLLHRFANSKATMTSDNLIKVMNALEISIAKSQDFSPVANLPCDPSKKIDIAKLIKIFIRVYRAKKIILFGSQATGKWRKDSDIDFLIVRDSNSADLEPGGDRVPAVREGVGSSYDAITITEARLKKIITSQEKSVIKNAINEGIVLYGA